MNSSSRRRRACRTLEGLITKLIQTLNWWWWWWRELFPSHSWEPSIYSLRKLERLTQISTHYTHTSFIYIYICKYMCLIWGCKLRKANSRILEPGWDLYIRVGVSKFIFTKVIFLHSITGMYMFCLWSGIYRYMCVIQIVCPMFSF